jgi:hypothetical protein
VTDIRRAKQPSWRRHCQEIDDVPGSARLMKIMSKQATNKVSTIRLPNRQFTQTGKGTLSEVFRVHFPDSLLIDDLDNGQGQQNLDTSRGKTNMADWDLAKVLITQSRIKWALDTFKPRMSCVNVRL